MAKALDRLDRRMLEELQADARISNQELAKRVGLSPAPCWRRLRRLEECRLIEGYVTLLNGRPRSACRSSRTRWCHSRTIIPSRCASSISWSRRAPKCSNVTR